MKKKIIKIIVTLVVIVALIGVATWLTMPVEECHLQLHRNVFDNIAFTEDNQEVRLPFEVMIASFCNENTTTNAADSVNYRISLLVQPMGNADPEKIENLDVHLLETATYNHHELYVEDFVYDEQEDRLIAFLKVERRRYQLMLNWLGAK